MSEKNPTYDNHTGKDFKSILLKSGGEITFSPHPYTEEEVQDCAETIQFEDIAYGLHRASRWTGQLKWRTTVLEHSLHCDDCLVHVMRFFGIDIEKDKKQRKRWAWVRLRILLHDAHEAFTGDLPHALKYAMKVMKDSAYAGIVWNLDSAIHYKYGLTKLIEQDVNRTGSIEHLRRYIDQLSAYIEYLSFHCSSKQKGRDQEWRLRRFDYWNERHLSDPPPWAIYFTPDYALEEFEVRLNKLVRRMNKSKRHVVELDPETGKVKTIKKSSLDNA